MMAPQFYRLRQRLEKIIWSRGTALPLFCFENGLLLLSYFYGGLLKLDKASYGLGFKKVRRLPCKLVSVGNIAVGGTGKTPFVRYLACLLKRRGLKVAILSRGYKGGAERSGILVSDGRRLLCSPRQAGDEPWLLAACLPGIAVGAGKNRYATGMKLIEMVDPDVVILDDGMQHWALERDLEIVLLDGADPLANGCLLPRGPLREPAHALARAHAMVLANKENGTRDNRKELRRYSSAPLFQAEYSTVVLFRFPAGSRRNPQWPDYCRLDLNPEQSLSGIPVFAFSGLARNESFFGSLDKTGMQLVGSLGFSDHHWYSKQDLELVCSMAKAAGARLLLTTAKDFVRLDCLPGPNLDLAVVDLVVDFGSGKERLVDTIVKRLGVYKHRALGF